MICQDKKEESAKGIENRSSEELYNFIEQGSKDIGELDFTKEGDEIMNDLVVIVTPDKDNKQRKIYSDSNVKLT